MPGSQWPRSLSQQAPRRPTNTPPPGYLLCDGAAFDGVAYPGLAVVLGAVNTPNLTGQFVRGGTPNLTPVGHTTAVPSGNALTISIHPGHNHHVSNYRIKPGWDGNSHGVRVPANNDPEGSSIGALNTAGGGVHGHTIHGGDTETAPDHVVLAYIIQAL